MCACRCNLALQGIYPEPEEQALIKECTQLAVEHEGVKPKGWLGPGLSQSPVSHTPCLGFLSAVHRDKRYSGKTSPAISIQSQLQQLSNSLDGEEQWAHPFQAANVPDCSPTSSG